MKLPVPESCSRRYLMMLMLSPFCRGEPSCSLSERCLEVSLGLVNSSCGCVRPWPGCERDCVGAEVLHTNERRKGTSGLDLDPVVRDVCGDGSSGGTHLVICSGGC